MKDDSNIDKYLEKAWTKRREKNYVDARCLVEEASRLCKEDDYNSLGRIFHIYMQIESDHDHLSKALKWCQKSLSNYKKDKNPIKVAHSIRHMADLQCLLGKEAESEQNYRKALAIYKSNSNTSMGDLANALRGFGLHLEKRGNIEEAISVFEEAKGLYLACHIQEGVDELDQKLQALK